MRRRHPTRRGVPPTRVIETEIQYLGARGDGIGIVDGNPVYVADTVPGDTITARVIGTRGEGLVAALGSIGIPSPERRTPPCPHALAPGGDSCGGCAVQQLSDDLYREWKHQLVIATLTRAGLDTDVVEPTIMLPSGNRRRAPLLCDAQAGACLSDSTRGQAIRW